MKKNFINLAMAAVVAFGTVAYTGCGKKGCMTTTDDKYDSAATESDPGACDPSGTDGKFVGNWTFTITGSSDTYSILVTDASAEYVITGNTNLGLNGVSAVNVSLNVDQDAATNSSFTIGNATISNFRFEYASSSSATVSGTISGTGISGVDGPFNDHGTK